MRAISSAAAADCRRAACPLGRLLPHAPQFDDGCVDFRQPVADAHVQIELLLQVRLGRRNPRVFGDLELLGQLRSVHGQAHCVAAGRRVR